jgi:hypothetical protein
MRGNERGWQAAEWRVCVVEVNSDNIEKARNVPTTLKALESVERGGFRGEPRWISTGSM